MQSALIAALPLYSNLKELELYAVVSPQRTACVLFSRLPSAALPKLEQPGIGPDAIGDAGWRRSSVHRRIPPEITGKLPGHLSLAAGLKLADLPSGSGAISKGPAAGRGQIAAYGARSASAPGSARL